MAHVYAELSNDVKEMNAKNLKQTTKTRQMTKEEMEQIFGGNPDFIKNINSNVEHQWTLVNWILLDTPDKVKIFYETVMSCSNDITVVQNITGQVKDTFEVGSLRDFFTDCDMNEPIMIKYSEKDSETVQKYLDEFIIGAPTKEFDNYNE